MSLSKFGKFKLPRSHDQCRAVVCCVCAKKVKEGRNKNGVSEKITHLVGKFVFPGYTHLNTLHPTAICDSCRVTLSAMDKVCMTMVRLLGCDRWTNMICI